MSRRGFRGYPIATIALYGPDDCTATKLAVGIVPAEQPTPRNLGVGSQREPISATIPTLPRKCAR